MPSGLSRHLLLAVVFLALAVALFLFTAERKQFPQPCVDGIAAMEAQDYDAAIDGFVACIETGELEDPVLADVYHTLGHASYEKGKYFQAVEDFSTALEINPGHAWAYNSRCWTYALLKRPQDALADCEEALRGLPGQPEVLDSRAFAYWQLGEIDKARADLERAYRANPKLPTPEARLAEFEALM